MKKVTTAAIAIVIAVILIITGSVYFGHGSMSHNFSLKGVETTDAAVKSFLEMMIPHHKEAVEASKLVMMDRDITNPDIRIFAAKIADAQEFEIGKMEGWYSEWFGTPYDATSSTYMPMMSDLSTITGDKRAKTYLKEMIAHHEMAVRDAKETREVIEKIQSAHAVHNGDLTVVNSNERVDSTVLFTKQIEDVQAKEIEEMKALLKTL